VLDRALLIWDEFTGPPSVNAVAPETPLKAAGVVYPRRPFSFAPLPMTTASGARDSIFFNLAANQGLTEAIRSIIRDRIPTNRSHFQGPACRTVPWPYCPLAYCALP
jgi:hypothetical protein